MREIKPDGRMKSFEEDENGVFYYYKGDKHYVTPHKKRLEFVHEFHNIPYHERKQFLWFRFMMTGEKDLCALLGMADVRDQKKIAQEWADERIKLLV